MTDRPSWHEYGIDLAATVATRADCSRRKVGAVIMQRDHTIVATGYNGAPSGGGSCLKGDCPRGRASTEEVPAYDQPGASSYDLGPGSCIALHAEQNALLRASWAQMEGSTLYVTCEPCGGCIRMLCGTPLDRVVWALTDEEERRLPAHVETPFGHVARIRAGRFERLQ